MTMTAAPLTRRATNVTAPRHPAPKKPARPVPRDRHHPGKGRRGGKLKPPPRLSDDEMGRLISAPREVARALDCIIERRLRRGEGPLLAELYRAAFGLPADHRLTAVEKRSAEAFLLDVLRLYGVRWEHGVRHSIKLKRSVYVLLRPQVVTKLTAAGTWPPRIRYRGPKGPQR